MPTSTRAKISAALTLAALIVFAAYSDRVAISHPDKVSRFASTSAVDIFGDRAETIVYLEQNWSAEDSLWFYSTTQGSNLLELDIFSHLEQSGNTKLFRSDANMQRYRYLPQQISEDNPLGLPVGFVANTYQQTEYVGLTCAACHTGQINYQGVGIRLDGGPPLTDLENLMYALESALKATLEEPEKFKRLARKLNLESQPQQLRQRLTKALEQRRAYNHNNRPLHVINGESVQHHYGFGRVDAVDRIFNRTLEKMTEGAFIPNSANAPVSYPQLWDPPQTDFVEWNGYGNNGSIGALARNAGQVMGVFGDFSLDPLTAQKGFNSSVNKRNLLRLERHLRSLQSPLWPALLPTIDQSLAEQGRQVFMEYRCNQCHADMQRDDPKRRITTQLITLDMIGTDPKMAENATQYSGPSGRLEGTPLVPILPDLGSFGETTAIAAALTATTLGVAINNTDGRPFLLKWSENITDYIMIKLYPLNPSSKRHINFEVGKKSGIERFRAYKSRPLNGLWATAPFLHNGSVANLYEMFLPSCSDSEIAQGKQCRAGKFTLGSREFDPIKVGLVQKAATQYPGLFIFDTGIPGNSNRGHEYAAGVTPYIKIDVSGAPLFKKNGDYDTERLPAITDAKRWALVEYLKTL